MPSSAAPFVPRTRSLKTLGRAVRECRGCDLYKRATQAVFGEGLRTAEILLVGEQPGDREDIAGRPFVGPAGAVLRRALEEAEIEIARVYVTNAVKHFRFVVRGKRRIHQKPKVIEIDACRPWLDAEIQAVQPRAIVALGGTAARSIFGRPVRLADRRGEPQRDGNGRLLFVTIHPANVLRQQERAAREATFASFVDDLHAVSLTLLQNADSRA